MVKSKWRNGYSLLELLIALSLGLILVFITYGLIISFNKSEKNLINHLYYQSQVNHFFEIIGFFLFNAGYSDPIKQTDNNAKALDYQFINDRDSNREIQKILVALPDELNKILPIQIVPDASPNYSNQQSQLDDFVTCDGYKVKQGYIKHVIVNIFWLDDTQIVCQSIIKNSEIGLWHLLDPASKKKIIIDHVFDFNVEISYEKIRKNSQETTKTYYIDNQFNTANTIQSNYGILTGVTIDIQLMKTSSNQKPLNNIANKGRYSTFFRFNHFQ